MLPAKLQKKHFLKSMDLKIGGNVSPLVCLTPTYAFGAVTVIDVVSAVNCYNLCKLDFFTKVRYCLFIYKINI